MVVAAPSMESGLAVRYWLARWDSVRRESHRQQVFFLRAALAADGGRGLVLELVLRCLTDPRLSLPAMTVLAQWRPPSGMETDTLVAAWLKRLEDGGPDTSWRNVAWQALAVLDGGEGRLAAHLLKTLAAVSEEELPCFLALWRPAAAAHRSALAAIVAQRVKPFCPFPSSRPQSLLKTALLELDAGDTKGFVWLQTTGEWKPSHEVDGAALRRHLDRLTGNPLHAHSAELGWQGRVLIDRGRGEWVSAMASEVSRRPVSPSVLSVLSRWQPQPGVETGELAAAWWKLAEQGLPPSDVAYLLPADPPEEVLLAWQALVNLDGGQGTHLDAFCRAVSPRTPWRLLKVVAEWKPASDEVEVGPLWEAWVNLLTEGGVSGSRTLAFQALMHLDRGRGWLVPLLLEWFPSIENHDGLLTLLCQWEPRSGSGLDDMRRELVSCWRKLLSHTYVTQASAAWEALFRLLDGEEEILAVLAERLPLEWRDKVLSTMRQWWPVCPARQDECFRLWAEHLGDRTFERRLAACSVLWRRLAGWRLTHPHIPEVLPEMLQEFDECSSFMSDWLRMVVLAPELGLDPQAAWYVVLGYGTPLPDQVQHLLAGMVDWQLGQCLAGGSGPVGLARCLQQQWLAMEEGMRLARPRPAPPYPFPAPRDRESPSPPAWKLFWQPFLSALGAALGEGSGVGDGFVLSGVQALAALVEDRPWGTRMGVSAPVPTEVEV